jgi:hypothetical protein
VQNTQPSRPHIERVSVNEITPPKITSQILALCDDLSAISLLGFAECVRDAVRADG